jgi:hypothetical protein
MSSEAASAAAPESDAEAAGRRFELLSGLTLAIFAAVLAISDLGGGKYGDDEIIGTAEKSSLYEWYQSKSIKQAIAQQQRDLLQSLSDAGAIAPEGAAAIKTRIDAADAEIKRYDREKKEITEGSAAVGPEGQGLEYKGQKGAIVGTKVWESTLETLGAAGDLFDMSTLWLQLCLVLGAISLVLHNPKMKYGFYGTMVVFGIIGGWYTVQAFQVAMTVG